MLGDIIKNTKIAFFIALLKLATVSVNDILPDVYKQNSKLTTIPYAENYKHTTESTYSYDGKYFGFVRETTKFQSGKAIEKKYEDSTGVTVETTFRYKNKKTFTFTKFYKDNKIEQVLGHKY